MKTQSIDTEFVAEKVQIKLLREKSVSEKLELIRSLSIMAIELSKMAIARTNKSLTEEEIDLLYIKYNFGQELADNVENYIKRAGYDNP